MPGRTVYFYTAGNSFGDGVTFGKRKKYVVRTGDYINATTLKPMNPYDDNGYFKPRHVSMGSISAVHYADLLAQKDANKRPLTEAQKQAIRDNKTAKLNMYHNKLVAQGYSDHSFAPPGVRVPKTLDGRLKSLNTSYLIASNRNPRTAAAQNALADLYVDEIKEAYRTAKDILPRRNFENLPAYANNNEIRSNRYNAWLRPAALPDEGEDEDIIWGNLFDGEMAGSLYGRRRRRRRRM